MKKIVLIMVMIASLPAYGKAIWKEGMYRNVTEINTTGTSSTNPVYHNLCWSDELGDYYTGGDCHKEPKCLRYTTIPDGELPMNIDGVFIKRSICKEYTGGDTCLEYDFRLNENCRGMTHEQAKEDITCSYEIYCTKFKHYKGTVRKLD